MTFVAPKRTTVRAHSSNYYDGRLKPIRLVVVHDGETGEGTTPAEGMGYWFQRDSTNASAHKGADTDSICHYVDDADTAWAARGANADGLHLELAGRASQTASQWVDTDSLKILENGAIAAAEWSVKHRIPARWLTAGQVADGVTKGFTTHNMVRIALKVGTHTDPGPNFPFDYFMKRVQYHVGRITGIKPPVVVAKPPVLKITGLLDKPTILRWQQVMGTKADGVISSSGSMLVEAVQRYLNARAMRDWDGRALVVDGKGILSNLGGSTSKTRTQYALQRLLGTTRDGIFSKPSNAIKVLQNRLNVAATNSKKF